MGLALGENLVDKLFRRIDNGHQQESDDETDQEGCDGAYYGLEGTPNLAQVKQRDRQGDADTNDDNVRKGSAPYFFGNQ